MSYLTLTFANVLAPVDFSQIIKYIFGNESYFSKNVDFEKIVRLFPTWKNFHLLFRLEIAVPPINSDVPECSRLNNQWTLYFEKNISLPNLAA